MPGRSRRNRRSPGSAGAWPRGRALVALTAFCLTAAVLLAGRVETAAPAGVEPGLDIRLGFDGIVKVGVPMPLEVGVPALPQGGRAELIVAAPALGPQAGTVVVSTVVPFDAVAGAPREFDIPIVLSDIRRALVIRLRIAGRDVARKAVTIDPARVGGRVVVAVGAEPLDLTLLGRLPGRVTSGSILPETLPRRWQEYAPIDLLVVHDLDEARVDDAQREALLTWVRLGGRLLVAPRPGGVAPRFLDPVLPAAVRSPLVAAAPAGRGWVTLWAFDPARRPRSARPGRLALWADALGTPARPLVDVAAAAAHLPRSTPLDPVAHAEVGLAILLYVILLFGVGRRYPTGPGAAACLALVAVGVAGFAGLASDVRGRATTLAQVTFLELAPRTGLARALTVAAVAVPYGGPFDLHTADSVVAAPVDASGDVRIERAARAGVLTARIRQGEDARAVYAIGTAQARASGWLMDDGRGLTVDLGGDSLRHAELWWRGRTYPLGDLPAGVSALRLWPDQWGRPPETDGDDRVWAWIFRGEGSDVLMDAGGPLLVGETGHPASAFSLAGGETMGRHLTVLLVSLLPQPPTDLRDGPGTPKTRP